MTVRSASQMSRRMRSRLPVEWSHPWRGVRARMRRPARARLTDAAYDLVVAAAPGHVEAVRHYVIDPLTASEHPDPRGRAPLGSRGF
ncbi:MAG: hypothetical protein M3171_08505 [Actinomycetota bacterium]|nr:hypothetical protein [Actinomycetota bacterium]